MQHFLIAVILGASLLLVRGAEAQEGAVINADGTAGTSTAETDPAVDADGPSVVYDDLNLGPGTNVIGPGASLLGPDGTYAVSDAPPAAVTMGDSRPLAPEPALVAETTTEPIVADTAIATETDADGDNYPDAQEVEIGLDPNNVDTDGDGVADGDEVNLYGTDPFTWDLDGDGVSDGDELYNTRTDPLVWDEQGTEAVGSGDELVAAAESLATDGDGDSDRLADADEVALGTDATNPDSDGDGYYDGDEANLATDPLDAVSVPTA